MSKAWSIRPLGEVCEAVGGGTPAKNRAEFYEGDIPWATVRDMRTDIIADTEFKITPIAVDSSATNVIPKNNVVIATRVGLGKVCLLRRDTAINQDLRAIIPKNNKDLFVPFLFWWLKSVAHLIVAEGSGLTVQGVKLPFIKALSIPMPELAEQQRIAAILDEAFAGLETTTASAEKNLRNARELFDSYLNSVFEKEGAEWKQCTLDQICSFSSGGTPSKANPPYWSGSIPWVSGKDMKSDRLHDAGLHISQAAVDDSATRIAPVGSLLILVRGMGLANGIAVAEVMSQCAFNQDIKALHPNSETDPRFLLHSLRAAFARSKKLLSNAAHGTLKIEMDELRAVPLLVPPLKTQKNVASRIDTLSVETQSLASHYQRKVELLEGLKKSLLHKAFGGELTSPPSKAIKEAAE